MLPLFYYISIKFENSNKSKCFPNILKNLLAIMKNCLRVTKIISYNVIIYAGENENVKEIHAHSNILRTRSQYFRTAYVLTLIII